MKVYHKKLWRQRERMFYAMKPTHRYMSDLTRVNASTAFYREKTGTFNVHPSEDRKNRLYRQMEDWCQNWRTVGRI